MAYPAELKENLITVPLSFESGEQGAFTIAIPWKCKLKSARAVVTKALAGTDAGAITISKGTSDLATITLAASSAIGTTDTASLNTDFDEGGEIKLTTAKTTAGGKVLLGLVVEILPL